MSYVLVCGAVGSYVLVLSFNLLVRTKNCIYMFVCGAMGSYVIVLSFINELSNVLVLLCKCAYACAFNL